jgi:hypothetical protein
MKFQNWIYKLTKISLVPFCFLSLAGWLISDSEADIPNKMRALLYLRISAAFSGYQLFEIAINHVRLKCLEGQTLPTVLLKSLSCVTHGNKLIVAVKLGLPIIYRRRTFVWLRAFSMEGVSWMEIVSSPTLWNHINNLDKLNSCLCFNKRHSFSMCKWGYIYMHSLLRFSSVS